MFSIPTNFIKVNEGLYKVVRTFKEEHVKNVDGLKELLHIDIVFRKDGMLYFCDTVQDLEIINE
tara:strand:+ start:241 stop:432 length:192 start_codon:yes stop_codon:yes gene_type:complete